MSHLILKKMFLLILLCCIIGYTNLLPSLSAYELTVNEAGKDNAGGHSTTNLAAKCGYDVRLVTPSKSDIWIINVTIISELTTQNVDVRIFEVIGSYPYNYEEQWDKVPNAHGTGRAELVANLNTSKTYEIWIRDAYAKQFTGVITETWRPYVLNGDFEDGGYPIPGWTTSGHIGHGSGATTLNQSRVMGLQQGESDSIAYQDIVLDKRDLVLSFWYRPYPEGTSASFKVLFDDKVILNEQYQGEDSDYNWRKAVLLLEPFLASNGLSIGSHRIKFQVPASLLPHAAVEIDGVQIIRMVGEYKVNTSISIALDRNHTAIGDTVTIFGSLAESSALLNVESHLIQARYSRDEGLSWWFLPTVYSSNDKTYRIEWAPDYPGYYMIEVSFAGDSYHYPCQATVGPLVVGSLVEIDEVDVSTDRCDVCSTQTVRFHVCNSYDHQSASGVGLVIGDHKLTTDSSGWASLVVSSNETGTSTWNIVSMTGVDDYRILVDPPSITWDKVVLEIPPVQRIDTNIDNLSYVGRYESNNEAFQGSLLLNDTVPMDSVGAYGYRVYAISDPVYGITRFKANEFQVIYDKVEITLSTQDTRIDISKEPEIIVSAKYSYDSRPFMGQISLNKPPVGIGPAVFTVQSIYDQLYGLTGFHSNEITCVKDRIKITEAGSSASTVELGKPVTVWFKAVYEYNETFDGSDGALFVNSQTMIWSSTNQRWEKEYNSEQVGSITIKITGLQDNKYGLTSLNDSTAPLEISWVQKGISGYPTESVVAGLVIIAVLLWLMRMNR